MSKLMGEEGLLSDSLKWKHNNGVPDQTDGINESGHRVFFGKVWRAQEMTNITPKQQQLASFGLHILSTTNFI